MARSTKNSGRASGKAPNKKFAKSKPSTSKANAAGYEKRRSNKAKLLGGLDTTDVYEYMPEKTRRERVRQDLDRDEAAEFGLRLEEANGEEQESIRARLIGEFDDDEKIDSEDDEELDSDAAFEESDEERFAGFFSSKKKDVTKKKPTVRFADVDLNEDDDDEVAGKGESEDEDEEEEGDDEFIDLLDVLDGKGEIDMGSDDEGKKKTSKEEKLPPKVLKPISDDEDEDEDMGSEGDTEDDDDEEDEEDEDEDADEDAEMAFAPSDDEDMSPEALDKLQDFVASLETSSKKRKAREEGDATEETKQERARKRRQIKERNEAGAEDEFRAQSSGKLNLEDLLNPLESQSSALKSLKNATKMLNPTAKAKPLEAPLAQRAQERLDREAAYDQTKQEVDKWTGTMKRIREAEHLSFPLQATPVGRTSNLELVAKFKPTTALESAVDSLLRSANLRDEDIHKTEETMLEMNKLSVEEVAERRAELRKMRELMFRAEIKAKRIKKIKSKTYRKLKRKEKERLGEKLGEGEDSDTEEGRLKREIERARERATLRHKNTGKWAKQMKHHRDDEGGRKEIEEMLARGEKLRRRIQGVRSDDESEGGDDSDDDNSDGDVEGVGRIKQAAFDELCQLDAEDADMDAEQSGKKGKSVFEMKFMKDAMARQQHAANKDADDFLKEMGDSLGDDSDAREQETQTDLDPESGVVALRQGGRIVYQPGTEVPLISTKAKGSFASDTSSVTLKSSDFPSPTAESEAKPRTGLSAPSIPESELDESNPWLVRSEKSGSKVTRKNNEIVVDKNSKAVEKVKNKLKKKAAQKAEAREQAQDDAVVEISMETVLTATPASASSSKTKAKAKQPQGQRGDDDDDGDSEVEIQEKMVNLKGKDKAKGLKAFEQKDLVARAFAGDNVVQQFEEAKQKEMEADAPKEIDTTIPGWGSWGGSGVRKTSKKPKFIKKVAGIDPTSRADFGKKHVIISEKRDKKAAKYLVKDLPFPYTSKAQFERAMDTPLGTEWNTRVAFQTATLPRVVKKPGAIIEPLQKLEY